MMSPQQDLTPQTIDLHLIAHKIRLINNRIAFWKFLIHYYSFSAKIVNNFFKSVPAYIYIMY